MIDETVYKATEEARVSKWLSRFSAGDPGSVQLPLSETKPGLQVHMRPPVFDKRVFEATEALSGGDKVTKHAASPRNSEVKAKTIPAVCSMMMGDYEGFETNPRIQSGKSKVIKDTPKSELGSNDSDKGVMFEPVYDDTYPLVSFADSFKMFPMANFLVQNAQTATGHEVNRSLLEDVEMVDRSCIVS